MHLYASSVKFSRGWEIIKTVFDINVTSEESMKGIGKRENERAICAVN